MMKKLSILALSIALLMGCNNDSDTGDQTTQGKVGVDATELVYILSHSVTCESEPMTAGESAQLLIDAGIDVVASECGRTLDDVVDANCGTKSTAINLHDIPAQSVIDAEILGFAPASDLTDGVIGSGYLFVDCPI